jgi:endonuclease/exonuclease/phosphatase family metal-dependent hydrolase
MLASLVLTSCTAAVNYVDSGGPRYAGGPGTVIDRDPSIRVVTFNIAYGKKYERASECFRDPPMTGADVVLLQEMDPRGVAFMAKALHMNFVYYPASYHPGMKRDIGNAVLSPWPIEATAKLILPHTTRVIHRERAAVVATVRIEGRPVRVYCLHLGSPFGLSGQQRGEQAEAVLVDARGYDGPVIVGGDLNSKSVGKRFEAAGFQWLTKSLGRTVGPFSFDHFFVRGLGAPAEAGIARTCKGASDHVPVWAVLPPFPSP